jgi:hypothetical protein
MTLLAACATLNACDQSSQPDTDNPSTRRKQPPTLPADSFIIPPHLKQPPADPRAALSASLPAGLLQDDATPNYNLQAVLRTAGVPQASQVLVFSKTSMQNRRISPRSPRAIYFNDDCYIGYVPGGLIEFADADADPAVGSGFFALDMRQGIEATLASNSACMDCHAGSRTHNRPGLLVRSVFPDEAGFPITAAGSSVVGHHTPLEERWGGWYVTGTHGATLHMGNTIARETDDPIGAEFNPESGANVTDLSPYFDTGRYLRPTSDIVALMVLEHQVQMHNLLTQGASVVHEQALRTRALAKMFGEAFDSAKSDTLQLVLNANADRIVKHMLFSEEIALASPIVGGAPFQASFRANRKEDRLGRSLKDFDLSTRMFKYRCSYMVYSRAFSFMPPLLRDAVMTKLLGVLEGQNDAPAYKHLGKDERKAIHTILQDTGVL